MGKWTSKIEREEKILDLIQNKKFVNPSELAAELGVSLVTIRRDLKELEERGLIVKNYNSISIKREYDKRFYERYSQYLPEKRIIAKLALNFVKPGDTLFIDTSTTCYEFAKVIASATKNIHIVTNSIMSAMELANNLSIEVTLIGGTLKSGYFSTIGTFAEEMMEKIKVGKIFMSCTTLDPQGLYESSILEGSFKKKAIANSKVRYLLVDSSKFDKVSIFQTAELKDIDVILTNKPLPNRYLSILRDTGTEFVIP